MRTVYLAGPIGSVSYDDAADWRQHAASRLFSVGIGSRDPLRHKHDALRGATQIPLFDNSKVQTSEGYIMTRDYYDSQHADLMLVKWDESMAMRGTCMEIGWFYMMHKPIIMWGDEPSHPMVLRALSLHVPDIDDAMQVVMEYMNV